MESDANVIARSVDQPAVFRVLFDRYFAEVHRYLVNRLAEPAVAEELAAETFVRAFAARDRYRDRESGTRAWLFTIATNLLRDEARARGRRRSVLDRLARERETVDAPSLGADPELEIALEELPAHEREALLLFAWADLSYEEIAVVLGVRIGTVRSRIHRARTKLRARLEPGAGSSTIASVGRAVP
ncbi:MAG TPA: sigma-70 family RNA polymerase sigma factor [Solirubrobacteraceae bacterium]